MSRLLCCLRARRHDMGAALSHPQEGEACDGVPAAPPTMADVIRERKKKAGGAGLGTLRRRIAAAARRPRDNRPDRGCEHARFIRSVVSSWRLAEVFLLCEELEAGAALRDLVTQAELAREPAAALHADLAAAYAHRWWCDVELVGAGWSLPAHRAILSARCTYFRDLLQRYPPGARSVPLEGAGASLSRAEAVACLAALYAGHSPLPVCDKYDRGAISDDDLDIINMENSNSCRGSSCGCARGRGALEGGALRRLGAALGFSLDSLHHDMRYLLDSGEMSDARLVFRAEGGGGPTYGFRSGLELPCHRLVLAARSRLLRSVMSRRSSNNSSAGNGCVCVDEKVLPRRFARALLHAAYTDQVDLSLIGRSSSSSPSSTNSTSSGSTAWPGVARSNGNGSRATSVAALDDAFQLYEIARFLEMPIVVQGCEDAIVEGLSADTLPHVLRWSSAAHASQWVHRQAMRYLRDEFPAIMSQAAAGRVPRAALAAALASPFLQASELQALRALLRWGHDQPHNAQREPNVVWHTAHSVSRRGNRRREVSDAALREVLAPLISLVRLEHVPPDNELLTQLVRRGVVPAACGGAEAGSAGAWLGRGASRPARCFLPYLDEIKALLEDQAVPEAEVSRVRRERYLHRIPDTLYMVAAARSGAVAGAGEAAGAVGAVGGAGAAGAAGAGAGAGACVAPRVRRALRARAAELGAAQPQVRALALHAADTTTVYTQIALRAVREMSLPDACADLLLADIAQDRERESNSWEGQPRAGAGAGLGVGAGAGRGARADSAWSDPDADVDSASCCRSGGARAATLGPADNTRAGTCRREMPSRSVDPTRQRAPSEWSGRSGRLSAAVPDVAMAPNANTHLLTSRDYLRHAVPSDYGGVVLQLDLGDGATHTPRPGSRAQRAHAARLPAHAQAMSCLRARPDEDELRAAIELSVIRAYSSFGGASPGLPAAQAQAQVAPAAGASRLSATLPHRYRHDLHPNNGQLPRASASPVPLAAAGSSAARRELHTPPPPHLTLSRVGSSERQLPAPSPGSSPDPSPSPRRLRRHEYTLYRHRHARHEYSLDPEYGGSGSTSRGHSPNNYA